MANRNRFTATVSMSAFAVSLAAMATPAVAQDVDPNVDVEAEADADAQSDDVIIVSGFRESLATSVSTKRNSDLILESVTAEDIGKLPDCLASLRRASTAAQTSSPFAGSAPTSPRRC